MFGDLSRSADKHSMALLWEQMLQKVVSNNIDVYLQCRLVVGRNVIYVVTTVNVEKVVGRFL